MKFTHHSSKRITKLKRIRQLEGIHLKPDGLWLSINNGWEKFCKSEMPDSLHKKIKYKVKVSSKHNFLVIDTEQKLKAFDRKYRQRLRINKRLALGVKFIDWKKVAKDYDGIIFPIYLYQCRYKYIWYYAVDCSSACIWNPEALTLQRDLTKWNRK